MDVDATKRTAWALELARFWGIYNRDYLDGALRAPALRLIEASAKHGSWHADVREIRIALRHVAEDPWLDVLGTLRHEMAHQYASEVLHADGDAPHGVAFRRACELLRVEPTARGGDDASRRDETSRIVARVHKLLALGASPNRNEAEAAMRKARALVAEHELHDLRSRGDRHFGEIELGPVKKRHARWEQILGGLLGRFFCVRPIWTPSYDATRCFAGTALRVYGSERNLAMAEHVHACLTRMLEPLWRAHRARHPEVRGDRDRQRYWEGVLIGFQDRLSEQEREVPAVRELALVTRHGGDPELQAYFRWHNPRVRSGRTAASDDHEAWHHGRLDGRKVSLQRPVEGSGGGLLGHGGDAGG